MTLKTIGLSAVAAAMITTAATAGTFTYTGTNATYVVASEIYLGTADVNNTIDGNNSLKFVTGSLPSGTVTEPAITIEFPTGVKAFASADANVTIQGGQTIGTIRTGSNGTNQLIFDKVTGASVNSNTELNITGSYDIQFADGTTSTTAEVKIGYSTDPSTADSGSVNLITVKDQVSATVSTKFNAFIDAANSFKLLVDAAGANAATDTATVTIDADPAGIDNAIATGDGTTMSLSLLPDNNVSAAGVMAIGNTAEVTEGAITQGADNNYSVALSVFTINATDEAMTYTYTPTGTAGANAIAATTFSTSLMATFPAGSKALLTAAPAGSWSVYGYSAQIPNVSGLSTHDTTMKFTNSSTTAAEIYFTLVDPDGTEATLNSITNTSLSKLGVNVTGTYKASALLALITDANFDKTGSFSVEVSIPTTPNQVYGMASFKNTTLGQFKDLPVYNSSTMSY